MAQPFHVLVALHVPRRHADFIVYANHIVESMTAHAASFPSPTPPLATVLTHLQALQAAETEAKGRAQGEVQARNVDFAQALADIHQLGAYVQSLADATKTPPEAAALITQAGMGTHHHGVHVKPDLVARMGPGGIVLLRAHAAGKRVAYEWQMSQDQGKSWTGLPPTTHAHTSVSGLTIGQSYSFRFRANIGGQLGDWHDPVVLLVH